jgi:hypothetical protein
MQPKQFVSKILAYTRELPNALIERRVDELKKGLSIPEGPGWAGIAEGYLAVCQLALTHEDIFDVFKRTRDYRSVVETVTKKQGARYADLIGDKWHPYLPAFQKNDAIGSPIVYRYPLGKFSPTTLRYIKTLSDLDAHFGSLEGFDIVEIGAGYGGQAKIISDVYRFALYTFVDLPVVMKLIEKYLGALGVAPISFTPHADPYDLVISNYAFAECGRRTQDDYIVRFLKGARRGYITYDWGNDPSPEGPYHREEIIGILSKFHKIHILPEEPKTAEENFLIVWK